MFVLALVVGGGEARGTCGRRVWCVTCVRRAHCEAAAGRHDLRPISRRVGSLVVLGSHSLDTPQYVMQHLPESSSYDELNRSALEPQTAV